MAAALFLEAAKRFRAIGSNEIVETIESQMRSLEMRAHGYKHLARFPHSARRR